MSAFRSDPVSEHPNLKFRAGSVGSRVGLLVGPGVGLSVGSEVGLLVGSGVGAVEGLCVRCVTRS